MAVDFFRHQEVARRKTAQLIVFFGLAVLGMVVLIYLAACFGLYLARDSVRPDESWVRWDPTLFFVVLAVVVSIVLLASVVKTSSLSAGGGKVIAEALRGRLVLPHTKEYHEKKLLNVVEEMAIASGLPVPPVYVMDHEEGINAFAAGSTPQTAVIGVTQGCMRTLNREELQGVVAHEFSHIFNGDMRMNLRLIGIIYGILALGLVGYLAMRLGFQLMAGGGRSRRSGKDSGGALAIVAAVAVAGGACWLIGYIGTFFGNIIKAAVSRQREYLADASAIEFTRHPPGLANALKKIGGLPVGSTVKSPRGREISHMFFGQAFGSFLGGLYATHPPLVTRIQRIEPEFAGRFQETRGEAPREALPVAGLAAAAPAAAGRRKAGRPTAATVLPEKPSGTAIEQIGRPTMAHLEYARELLAGVPAKIVEAAGDPFGARAVVHLLLLDRGEEVRALQLRHLENEAERGVYRMVWELAPQAARIDPAARLPLLDKALPALRELTAGQYESFRRNALTLIHADQRVEVFEWALWQVIERNLDRKFRRREKRSAKFRSWGPVSREASVLLSALAWEGAEDDAAVRHAFGQGIRRLTHDRIHLLDRAELGLGPLDEALETLDGLPPPMKGTLLAGCAAAIAADREVTIREAELFRAIAEALGVPTPPLLPGQPLV